MRLSFSTAALLAAALLVAANSTAQRPGSDTTNVFTPEMKLFSNPDPRIAEFEQAQRSGTPVRQIGAVELSPDGKELAWILAGEAAGGRRGGGAQLHISPAAKPSPSDPVVTAGEGCSASAPRWSPDGKSLAFVATCGAERQPQLWLRASSGAVKQLTHIKGTLTSPAWAPDGSSIAFLYVENATRSAGALAAMKPPAGIIGEDGIEIQWVAAADARTGDIRLLTPKTLHTYEFDWAPDAKHIAFIAANPPGENTWWIAKMYTAPTGQPDAAKPILDPVTTSGSLHGLQIAVPRYSTDGKNIAFIGGLMSDQGSTGGDIYLMGADGSGLQDLTPGRKDTPVYLVWDRPGPHRLLRLPVRQIAPRPARHQQAGDCQPLDRCPIHRQRPRSSIVFLLRPSHEARLRLRRTRRRTRGLHRRPARRICRHQPELERHQASEQDHLA